MNLNLKGVLACGAVLCALNVKAQRNDYVINAKGDTIHCEVSSSKYKINGGKSIKMKPDSIREYYRSEKDECFRAVYREKKSKAEYFKVLEKGKIMLFEGITSYAGGFSPMGGYHGGSSSTQWYITKGTDTVKEVKNNDFTMFNLFGKSHKARKNDFEEMISDNADVLAKYKAEDKFSFKQVRNLIHIYNTGEPFKEK
ncbi:hypothetical protein D0C36_05665 [Mucilaginibacter conchicola]|uniref:Uncharacterized protein n=1 Tax=Mucilaginibacter conchicola TaxID=2303333 RepID=A0A372NYP6_9SPHI|nr:hypothetical protein [Mucilaginibacter conchicola]RFZ95014.1 hypothetical protein D0C36_05665 [Mucilaginibacter conchicola]